MSPFQLTPYFHVQFLPFRNSALLIIKASSFQTHSTPPLSFSLLSLSLYTMPPVPLYHEPDATTAPPPSFTNTTTKWGPYSSSSDFTVNMIIILVALLAALGLALAVNALIKYLFCPRRQQTSGNSDIEKPPPQPCAVATQLPETIYESGPDGDTKECTICLSEFANGDKIRVLPACGHGFHVRCIEKWINGGGSCPTCRAKCDVGPTAVKSKVEAGCGV